MTNPFERTDSQYRVLVNDENQYSLWPDDMDIPPGWKVAKTAASRQECLTFVDETWTDMRPLSLVRSMERGSGA